VEVPEVKSGAKRTPEEIAKRLGIVRAQLVGKMGGLTSNGVAAAMIAASLVNKNIDVRP
jgi:hypothetical protein